MVNEIIEYLNRALSILKQGPPSDSKGTLALYLKKIDPSFSHDIVSLALDTYLLRPKAVEKFGLWASEGFFSSSLLPQASRTSLSQYRARYFAGRKHVLEIGTGTGSDTAALAGQVKKVTTIEQDPIRTAMAQHNLTLQGITNVEFITGDIKSLRLSLSDFDALFADPARRTVTGTRVKDAAQYSPPLEDLLNLPIDGPSAIKVSPGLFFDHQRWGWSRQFLGYRDQCLEQTLWRGIDITDSSVVVVDAEETWSPPVDTLPDKAKVDSLGRYLFEAHGVINRSLRLDDFFAQLGIARFDNDVAYGTSDELVMSSRLLSRYTVLDNFRYSRKTLQTALHERQWTSRTEFKKRACNEDLEEIRRAMKLPSHHGKGEFGTVFLFRWRDCNWVVLGKRDNE